MVLSWGGLGCGRFGEWDIEETKWARLAHEDGKSFI